MRFYLLLLISFSFYQCSNTEQKQVPTSQTTDSSTTSHTTKTIQEEQATEVNSIIVSQVDVKRVESNLKTILKRAAAFKKQFGNLHQHIPYTMFANNQFYFVVIKGNWKEDNWDNNHSDPLPAGSYKVGLVNELNEIIIPTQYDKIYNMGGVASNLIEVELNGKLGAYNLDGVKLLHTEFDAIYPYTNAKDVWVQVRKGGKFGWLNNSGQVSLDPSSHSNEGLFKAQPFAGLLSNWSFSSKSKKLIPFFTTEVADYENEPQGLLILPSYLYHLDLVPEFRTRWNVFPSYGPGNGETEATIQTARKAGKNQTIVSAFKQYFADPRGDYEEQSDIITVNEKMEPIDKLTIKADYVRMPCTPDIRFHFIDDNTLEVSMNNEVKHPVYKMMTTHVYHKISSDGKISLLKTQGWYPFTQMTKITNSYFKGCFLRNLTDEENARLNDEDNDYFMAHAKLEHLTIEDLDLMRNEIYALHGYKFKSKKWQDYFGKQTWYKAQFDNVDDQLTEIEKHNITAILNQKKKMEGNEVKFTKRIYEPFVAAG